MSITSICDLRQQPIASQYPAAIHVIAFGRSVQWDYHQGRNRSPTALG